MAEITFKGNKIHTSGNLPAKGATVPDMPLVKADLSEATIASFGGRKVLNIFPSIDTAVCATSVRKFNEKAASRAGVTVLNISLDLPFAQKRFCGAEGIDKAVSLSAFRSDFVDAYGLRMTDGPLKGLSARAVLVVDENNKVIHSELVPEIAQEPNYDAALAALG